MNRSPRASLKRASLKRASAWISPGVRFEPAGEARRCGGCGYPFPGGVRGAPAPCTECGRFIDPAAPDAFKHEGPGWLVRQLLHAPGLPMLAAVAAAGALYLHGISVPGDRLGSLLFGISGILMVGSMAALRGVSALVLGMKKGCSRAVWSQRGWWLLALMAAIVALLARLDVPRRVSFAVDRSGLDALADVWERDPLAVVDAAEGALSVANEQKRPIDATELERFGSRIPPSERAAWRGFIVEIRGAGFMDEQGAYFYLPDLDPAVAERQDLMHHGGGWYSGSFFR